MTQSIEAMTDLIAISLQYGADPAFVLAGGGNTSLKQGNRLWVKASGHALATIGADGFVELDRDALEAMLNSRWPHDPKEREALFVERVMASRLHPERKQRPSVEALLHHLLPEQLVVHTHPGIVNALTCCIDGQKLAATLFGDDVLWQEYVDPGLILAQTLKESLRRHQQRSGHPPAAIFLANHGLIVPGRNAADIQAISDRIIRRIRNHLAAAPAVSWKQNPCASPAELVDAYATAMARLIPDTHIVGDSSQAIIRLVSSAGGLTAALAGPLTPDQIVDCRSIPLWVDHPSSDVGAVFEQLEELIAAYREKQQVEPWVALIAGAGMISFRESSKLAEITRSIYVDAANIYQDADRLGGVRVLDPRDQQFIEQWEVEAYRRSIMRKSNGESAHGRQPGSPSGGQVR
jgi:rhamnulokinase